jgi:hypothetical protein
MDIFLNNTTVLVSIQALWVDSAASLLSNVADGDDASNTSIRAVELMIHWPFRELLFYNVIGFKYFKIQSLY